MDKKGIAPLIIIIILGLAIAGGTFYVVKTGKVKIFQGTALGTGCSWANITTIKPVGNNILYTCTASVGGSCYVTGYATFDVMKVTSAQTCSECKVGIDWYNYLNHEGGYLSSQRVHCTVGNDNSGWKGCKTGVNAYGGTVGWGNANSVYSGPLGSAYKQGPLSSPISITTEEVKLAPGQQILFQPKDLDNVALPSNDYYIDLKIEDCTCSRNVASGANCDLNYPSKILCTPTKGCSNPSYNYYAAGSIRCASGDFGYGLGIDAASKGGICSSQVASEYGNCVAPITVSSKYLSCTNNKDTAGCYKWNTVTDVIASPQTCILTATNAPATVQGLGGKGCINSCVQGTTRDNVGSTEPRAYQLCEASTTVTSCNVQKDMLCPELTKYDQSARGGLGDCVLNFVECTPGTASCPSATTLLACKSVQILNPITNKLVTYYKMGGQYGTADSLTAGDERTCHVTDSTRGYAAWDCVNTPNTCDPTKNPYKCGSTNKQYQECKYGAIPATTCPKYRTTTTVPAGQICVNNDLIDDPEQGCAYGTETCTATNGFICGKNAGLPNDDPDYNECICDSSKWDLASYSDYQTTQCKNNYIQTASRIGVAGSAGPEKDCYQWKNAVNPCGLDQVCVMK